jgi:hypothetical protein
LPIVDVNVLKLLRCTVVVLRPKVEEDRFARGERSVFGRLGRGASGPCTLIVVKGVHRWEKRVDMADKLLRVRPISWWYPSQSVVAVIPTFLPGASARVQSARVASTFKC